MCGTATHHRQTFTGAAVIFKVRNSSNGSNVSVVLKLYKVLSLLFLTFSVLVANPRGLLETVANPPRGLLNPDYFMVTKQLSCSKQSGDAQEPHSHGFYDNANNAHLQ